MSFKSSLKYFFRNLREKHRLSFRNQHNDTEVWYMHISPLNLLAGFFALILILFVVVMSIVAFTPVLDIMPGNQGSRSRTMLINNIMRLDSLEREIDNMQIYGENVGLIMQGRSPVTREDIQRMDSLSKITGATIGIIPEDSVLRAQMEAESGPYSLNDASRRVVRGHIVELYPPVQGVVLRVFNPVEGSYGVTVTTAVNQPVMAVMDGTVISSGWTPEQGNVVFIQHADNFVSVYRNNTSVLKKVGERVRSGEVIGYTGAANADAAARSHFEFELWDNGAAVDPAGYVVF